MINNFMIFGDSYSTHKDYIDEKYLTFYSSEIGEGEHRVHKMLPEETWWGRLIKNDGAKLVRNDSWSGSTIGYTGYENSDCSATSSFIYRFKQLVAHGFFKENKIDTLIIFGGTNDSWCEAPLGTLKFSDWKEEEFYSVLPAVTYFLELVRKELPDTRIICIINTELKPEIAEALRLASERNRIQAIELHDITKDFGHPTIQGMKDIYEQVIAAL
jgi:hypothetical protein